MKKLLIPLLVFASMNVMAKTSLETVIKGEHRSQESKARDIYRHPQETLEFFEVKDNMTVVEIWPGSKGWYTEILAPYLKDNGKLYAAHFSADSDVPFFRESLEKFNKKIAAQPEIYANLELTVLQPPKSLKIAPDESADRVLTFRNVHNWMANEQAEMVFEAMYKALKKGGILGVVEHRAAMGSDEDVRSKSGYVSEDYLIQLAEKAGFKLLEKSEINANPKDTTFHPEGVWTLPPTLRLKEKNKLKYLAIGESDRMTLKFIKP